MSFFAFYFAENGQCKAGNVLGGQKTCFISSINVFHTRNSCSKQKIEEKNVKVYLVISPGSPWADGVFPKYNS